MTDEHMGQVSPEHPLGVTPNVTRDLKTSVQLHILADDEGSAFVVSLSPEDARRFGLAVISAATEAQAGAAIRHLAQQYEIPDAVARSAFEAVSHKAQ